MRRFTDAENAERQALYARGMDDAQMAAATGSTVVQIGRWRRIRNLPAHSSPFVPTEMVRRCTALLTRGISARLIANETGVNLKTLERWRSKILREQPELRGQVTQVRAVPRHSNGRAYKRFAQPRRGEAFLLYADGLDDRQIGDVYGISRSRVWEWRSSLHLPPNAPQGGRHGPPKEVARKVIQAPITPLSNPTHAAIVASLAKWAAPDLRDDMASEMWVALLEGRFSAEQISAEANSICNQVARDLADRFGPRSLDEDLSDGEGFKLLDLIRDERSSSWLEEMGATAW